MLINRFITAVALAGSVLATTRTDASRRFDIINRVMLDASGRCEVYLTEQTKRALPNPTQVYIDRAGKRILFAVDAFDAEGYAETTLPEVRPQKRMSSEFFGWVEQRNREARDAKPDEFVWIDVTEAWEGFGSLWRAYERYATDLAAGRRPGSREVCYTFAAIHNGFEPNLFMFNEFSYFERGFVEISDVNAGTADVGLIQHRIALGGYQLWHAFVPIPGTDWVMHKEGSQELRIVRRAEAWRSYGSSDGTASIRYLHRRETLKYPSRVIAPPAWVSVWDGEARTLIERCLGIENVLNARGRKRIVHRDLLADASPLFKASALDRLIERPIRINLFNRKRQRVPAKVRLSENQIEVELPRGVSRRAAFITLIQANGLARIEINGARPHSINSGLDPEALDQDGPWQTPDEIITARSEKRGLRWWLILQILPPRYDEHQHLRMHFFIQGMIRYLDLDFDRVY